MKKIVPLLLASLLVAGQIELEVKGLENANGELSVGLYSDAKEFAKPNSKVYKGVFVKASKGAMVVRFSDVADGIYAISIFHDENSNKTLDTNLFGLPKEGYAFSNNIRPTFRAATFDEAKFEVKGDKRLIILMKY